MANIGTRTFLVVAPDLLNKLSFNVRAIENITKFNCHLNVSLQPYLSIMFHLHGDASVDR